jgi:hypothetical protein
MTLGLLVTCEVRIVPAVLVLALVLCVLVFVSADGGCHPSDWGAAAGRRLLPTPRPARRRQRKRRDFGVVELRWRKLSLEGIGVCGRVFGLVLRGHPALIILSRETSQYVQFSESTRDATDICESCIARSLSLSRTCSKQLLLALLCIGLMVFSEGCRLSVVICP